MEVSGARRSGGQARAPTRTRARRAEVAVGHAPTALSITTKGGSPDSSHILALQRTAGNRAAGDVLSRRRTDGADPGRVPIQRDPETATATATALFGGISALLERLAGGLETLTLRMLIQAGVDDEAKLTNLVFWARHPSMYGKRIEADQQDLATEWIRLRDQIVRPALRAGGPSSASPSTTPESPDPAQAPVAGGTAVSGGGSTPTTAGGAGGIGAHDLGAFGDEDATQFRRAVFERQKQLSARAREFYPGVPPGDLATVEGTHQLHSSAAADAASMLAAARADLAAAKERGDELASKVVWIRIGSAYRDPRRDFRAWQNTFAGYYEKTAAERAKFADGPHGEQAMTLMVKTMRRYKAVPGFSNHTRGLALDLRTKQGKWTFGASSAQNKGWKNTWLWKWLVVNAATYNFHPYAAEAWHWDHRS